MSFLPSPDPANRLIEPALQPDETRVDTALRPQALDDFIGQDQLKKTLSIAIAAAKKRAEPLEHVLLYGNPGLGKTTLSHIIGREMNAQVRVTSGPALEKVGDLAAILSNVGQGDVLFVDEIHRFNKSQQDALLPYVEKGVVTLIGANTENPSFEVNPALRSRCRVFVLERLSNESLRAIIEQALRDTERGLGGQGGMIEAKAVDMLVMLADGDARQALTALEFAFLSAQQDQDGKRRITVEHVREALQRAQFTYDKNGEEHYNIISALHKSMRGSDANAALYWLARMLEGGEDPLYIARRLIRFASEDVGMADPQALPQAVAAYEAAHMIGMPECNVILSQAVVYLAKAKKSNALYAAYKQAAADVRDLPNEPVPLHLRNAPTGLMKDLGYGKGYIYNPNAKGEVKQEYLPDRLKGRRYIDAKSEG